MQKVLITGIAGFIGSNLAKRCIDENWQVYGVDDLCNGHVEFIPKYPNKPIWFAKCDFASDEIIELIRRERFDTVFHIAAVPRVSYSVEHPIETNDVNVSRTLKLLNACRDNVRRVVFASSSSVYGGADVEKLGATHELIKKNPKSPYALQKSIIEDYLALYGDLYGLDSICLRFFNVFGPNQLGDSPYATAVSAWLSAIKKGKPMRSDGTGEQSRDMCYVDNVTDACVKASSVDRMKPFNGRCYNIACGERTTNNEIMNYLLERYPNATKIDAPWRPGDVMHTHADITRAKNELGYVPLVKFWDGLRYTIGWVERTPEFLTLKLNT